MNTVIGFCVCATSARMKKVVSYSEEEGVRRGGVRGGGRERRGEREEGGGDQPNRWS